jgi:hypothetical protein
MCCETTESLVRCSGHVLQMLAAAGVLDSAVVVKRRRLAIVRGTLPVLLPDQHRRLAGENVFAVRHEY